MNGFRHREIVHQKIVYFICLVSLLNESVLHSSSCRRLERYRTVYNGGNIAICQYQKITYG